MPRRAWELLLDDGTEMELVLGDGEEPPLELEAPALPRPVCVWTSSFDEMHAAVQARVFRRILVQRDLCRAWYAS